MTKKELQAMEALKQHMYCSRPLLRRGHRSDQGSIRQAATHRAQRPRLLRRLPCGSGYFPGKVRVDDAGRRLLPGAVFPHDMQAWRRRRRRGDDVPAGYPTPAHERHHEGCDAPGESDPVGGDGVPLTHEGFDEGARRDDPRVEAPRNGTARVLCGRRRQGSLVVASSLPRPVLRGGQRRSSCEGGAVPLRQGDIDPYQLRRPRGDGIELEPSRKWQFSAASIAEGCFRTKLRLAPLNLNATVSCWLVNMAAFEMYVEVPWVHDCSVNSYLSILSLLINQTKDARKFRAERIIQGSSSDQAALEFIKGLGRSLSEGQSYVRLITDLEGYRRRRWLWIPIHRFCYRHKKPIAAVLSIASVLVGIFKTLFLSSRGSTSLFPFRLYEYDACAVFCC